MRFSALLRAQNWPIEKWTASTVEPILAGEIDSI